LKPSSILALHFGQFTFEATMAMLFVPGLSFDQLSKADRRGTRGGAGNSAQARGLQLPILPSPTTSQSVSLPGARRKAITPSIRSRAVLIGVDLGPNLSVTASLASILWLTALRREGHNVSTTAFLRLGIIVTPPALLLALAASFAFS
jgi:arsenical pump membrane protein